MTNLTLREEAEQIVKDGYCGDCKGSERGCEDGYDCDGFKNEVENILKEWAEEDAGEQPHNT